MGAFMRDGNNVFYVEYTTAGKTADNCIITATKVTIESVQISTGAEGLRIDLADHPLYKKLEQYVLANPSLP